MDTSKFTSISISKELHGELLKIKKSLTKELGINNISIAQTIYNLVNFFKQHKKK